MGGKVVVDQIQGRTVPTDTTGQLGGYTSWHRDGVGPTGLVATHPANALTIKTFTFPFDVAEDQGPAAVVPGSHPKCLGLGLWYRRGETLKFTAYSAAQPDLKNE